MNTFIRKVELYVSLKGYTGEKAAQFLASRLDGAAFDVYMRLEEGEKKDADKLKEELRKEFEKGKSDREVALNELSNRRRKPEEAATTFAYKLDVLVTLAYPNFDASAKKLSPEIILCSACTHKCNWLLKHQRNFPQSSTQKY